MAAAANSLPRKTNRRETDLHPPPYRRYTAAAAAVSTYLFFTCARIGGMKSLFDVGWKQSDVLFVVLTHSVEPPPYSAYGDHHTIAIDPQHSPPLAKTALTVSTPNTSFPSTLRSTFTTLPTHRHCTTDVLMCCLSLPVPSPILPTPVHPAGPFPSPLTPPSTAMVTSIVVALPGTPPTLMFLLSSLCVRRSTSPIPAGGD